MNYIKQTNKTVDQAVADLEKSIVANQFGVMHIHNLHATLNKKGIPFEQQCQILEVCNPHQAARVLNDDMEMNMALPCRVSVYEKDGKNYIGMISPKAMLSQLSDSEELKQVAAEVEAVISKAIDEAV